MRKLFAFITSISVGLILIAFWGWLWYNAESFVSANPEAFKEAMLKNIVFTTLIFSLDSASRVKTEKGLFSLSIVKGFPKFFASMTATVIILRFIGGAIKSQGFPSILDLLSSSFVPIIIAHTIIIAIPEELAFRGFFSNELKSRGLKLWQVLIMTSVLFGLYHWAVDYGNWTSIAVHSGLGALFFLVKIKGLWPLSKIPKIGPALFGPSPETQMTNAGCHAGLNLFSIGLLQ